MYRKILALSLAAAVTVPAFASERLDHFLSGQNADLGALAPHAKADFNVAAKAALQNVLVDHLGARGDEEMVVTRVGTSEGAQHVRFGQTFNGLEVVGADMYLHTDDAGNVTAVNGSFLNVGDVALAPELDAERALAVALGKARVQRTEAGAELVYVLDADGKGHLAWQTLVSYTDAEGAQLDKVFASATTGELVARHPQHHYARVLRTYDCNNGTSCGSLFSSSSNTISTSDLAIRSAHNYAIATYNYFDNNFGRDSIDDNGMTLRSRVHYSNNYNNAFWDGYQMTYGDGDGTTFIALSRDADVVAHELTHGVTENDSGLIYQNESGALNEAWSDIFGAMVDRQEGASGSNIWKIGEDIYTPGTPGDALRNMADPVSQGDYDYYPTRYTGSADNGGVHSNSGIANLAFKLLVTGGTHPRGKTSVNVQSVGYTTAASIFYNANKNCLTQNSTFQSARNCTAQFAGSNASKVHLAWDAVGVPGSPGGGGGSCTANAGSAGNLSGSSGSTKRYTWSVPSSCSQVIIKTSGGSGDVDLYVKRGSQPSTSSYDCRPYKNGNNETCTFNNPSSGTYHIMLRGYSSYSGVRLDASHN